MDKRLTPARIALLYAVFASLWIFASDKIMAVAIPDPALMLKISMFKGIAFVIITTWLLYQLMRTLVYKQANSANPTTSDHGEVRPARLAIVFLCIALIVPLFGFAIAKIYGPRVQQVALDDLSAVANLKAAQIETWLKERKDDADEIAERAGFIEKAEQWMKNGDASAKVFTLARMATLSRVHGYDPIMLHANGNPAMASPESSDPVARKVWNELLRSALKSGKTQRSGLYRDSTGKIRMDYVALLKLSNPQRTVGAIVLRAPVEQFLFPLIQSWPTASTSAETVLVRRDGDQVLFLNELRHRSGTALSLRLPLDDKRLPAAAAILIDRPQTMEAVDYRGIDVLAATHPIQGTDWHLVAKIDRDEVMHLLGEMIFWVSLLAILTVGVVAIAILLLWRQQQRLFQMDLNARTAEKDKLLKLFYDLPFIGMAISSPSSKAWLYANDHLCEMLGYTRDELLQTTWANITYPDDLAVNVEQFERMKAGEIDGYTLEKRFIRKDGSPLTVNLNVKCTRWADGKVDHIVAMIEDITESKKGEALLLKNEQALLEAQKIGGFGSYDYDIANDKWTSSVVMDRIFGIDAGFPRNAIGWGELIHPTQRDEMLAYLQDIFERYLPFNREYRIFRQCDGDERWVHGLGKITYSSNGIPLRMTGTIQDITERRLAEASLRASEATYRSLIDNMLNGVSHCRMIFRDGLPVDYEYIAVNLAFERITGLKDVVGKKISEIIPGYCEDNPESLEIFGKVSQSGEPARWEHYLAAVGKWFAFSIYSPAWGEFVVVSDDITERKLSEESLRQAATVFESSHDGIMITDLEGRIQAVNRSFNQITGYTENEVRGLSPNILHSGRQKKDFYQSMWASIKASGYWQGEIWNRRKNGETYPEWLTISAVHNAQGEITRYVGVFSDLSKLKQSETQLEHLAHYDPLTDLPNRLLVLSHLTHAVSQAHRQHHMVGVLYIDLDRFKNINESLGYPVGDELLIKLTERLTMHMRSENMLARLGGDEFLLVQERMDSPDDAATAARSLLDLLNQPFVLSGEQEIFIGASIGISVYPNDGSNADQLIQYADAAMHQAKQFGRNTYLFYTESLTRASGEHLELETRLRHAITANQLRVYYQPQVDIATGRIIGAEALVRWQDPERGLISPANFIPLAEETGLISTIGEWVLKEACRQGTRWINSGLPFLTLAVNLSPHQFHHGNIADLVSKVLAETGFPADRLELELTESALMQHEEAAVKMLHLLRALGIRLAIDDFGTGYSSLSYLKRFPLDILKIDKSFVDDIPFHQDDMEIASAIIAMGHTLGFKVLAEGVETEEQLAFLRDKGCDMYQGYITSRPLPAAEFERLVAKK